jgi:hypothetical protein
MGSAFPTQLQEVPFELSTNTFGGSILAEVAGQGSAIPSGCGEKQDPQQFSQSESFHQHLSVKHGAKSPLTKGNGFTA